MEKYKLQVEDLVEKVYKTLKQMILSNELIPGQKLLQEEIAGRLGVSRTPLLSALSKLEKEMLIEAKPRRGYYVKKLSQEEELDLYDIRLRLEPLGALKAAEKATPQQIKILQRQFERFEEGRNKVKFSEFDYDFHNQIMKMSGSEMLERIISSFNIIMLSNQMELVKETSPSILEYREIIDAISRKDAPAAEKAMLDHIEQGKKRVVDYRERSVHAKN